MLINTKHIVLFDDVVNDFARIANMVDNDGAVLILRDGKPAYAVVSFEDVQEDERPRADAPTVEATAEPSESKTCNCGRHQGQCDCGSGPAHRHGPHHQHHGAEAEGERPCGHGHGHHGHPHGPGGPGRHEHFGHGADAGHLHPDEEPAWGRHWERPGDQGPESEWDFSFHTGPAFDPLFRGGPDFSIDEFIGKVPPELLDAGRRFVNQLSPLIGLFGGATGATPTDNPDSKE